MKTSMTNFDINAIISELTQRLSRSELKNIFELNDKFFFRFRTKTEGTQLLVVEPGKRIHITKYKQDFPSSPSGLCKAFRVHIKGKWLSSIEQYDFDRICILKFEAYDKVYTLVIELFGKGNIILISPENKIYVAKNYKKMRDRDIHPGIEFEFPPSSGKNFFDADLLWVEETLKERSEKNITTLISRTLNINKLYAQEICELAGVDHTLKKEQISDEIIAKIIVGVKELRKIAKKTKLDPVGYTNAETGELVDIVPFPLKLYSKYKAQKYGSFSEALDQHFSTVESDKVSGKELSAEEKRIKHIESIKKKQEDHLAELQKQIDQEKEHGNAIYLFLAEIDELLSTITEARHNNVPWAEIKEKLKIANKKGMKGARLIKKIKEKNKTIVLDLDGKDIELDFLKSASDNANIMYKRAKKAEGKLPGTQKKIKEYEERIEKMRLGLVELSQKESILIERRKRQWFEKFHWFKSSDGFLVIAGKDLRTNNEIVKKYLEKDDLFLHAEIHGASVVVIKGEGKPIPETTINEAAVFSVVYSKAWKDRVSAEDTFWVKPEQVSFSAPSGEYLAKGSFIIKGSKNIIKKVPLELAVAPIIEEKWAYTIGFPLTAIEKMDNISKDKIVKVIPGDTIKSKMAKSILAKFSEGMSDTDIAKINDACLNDLISILPGNSFIKQD